MLHELVKACPPTRQAARSAKIVIVIGRSRPNHCVCVDVESACASPDEALIAGSSEEPLSLNMARESSSIDESGILILSVSLGCKADASVAGISDAVPSGIGRTMV